MALLYQDTFERADGDLGGDWLQAPAAGWLISSNRATPSGSGAKYAILPTVGVLASAYLQLTLDASMPYVAGSRVGVMLCENGTASIGYLLRLDLSGADTGATLQMWKNHGLAGGNLIADYRFGWVAGEHILGFLKAGNVLQALLDGVVVMSIGDATFSNGYVGMYASGLGSVYYNDFKVYDADLSSIQVEPSQVRCASVANQLYIIGAGTSWTPGIPGEPVFEVDQGVISEQEIDSATRARALYAAPANPCWERITDPDTGKAGLLGVSLTQQMGGYTHLQTLSDDMALWLKEWNDQLATWVFDGVKAFLRLFFNPGELPPDQSAALTLLGPPEEGQTVFPNLTTLLGGLATILVQLTDETPEANTIRRRVYDALQQAEDAASEIALWRGDPPSTAADERLALQGEGTTTLLQILTRVNELRTGYNYTLADVAAWHVDLRGAGNPDLAALVAALGDVLTAIAGVRGEGNPDLAAVLAAIAAIPPFDPGEILAAVAGVRGEGSPDIAGALTAVAGVLAAVGVVGVAVGAIPVEVALELAGAFTSVLQAVGLVGDAVTASEGAVLGAVEAAQGEIDGRLTTLQETVDDLPAAVWQARLTPCAWPGVDNVVLGDPVALSADLIVPGPMDGALLAISAAPSSAGRDQSGDLSYWYRLGWFSFMSDNGFADERQFLAWSTGLMSSRHCVRPGSLVIHCRPGVVGTVTPWLVSE